MHKILYLISLLYASTCFEHYVLIIRRSKLYYTASGIVTHCRWPSGVHRLREDSLNLCTPDGHVQCVTIPDAVKYNFELLMMSTQCSKHVEAYNKLIIKQSFCAFSWLITKIILRCTVSKTLKKILTNMSTFSTSD